MHDPNISRAADANDATMIGPNQKINLFQKIVRVYLFLIVSTVAVNSIIQLPFFSDDKLLPYFISFSWQNSETVYWLAYIVVVVGVTQSAVIILFTVLLWYIMLNYSIAYECLGNKIRMFGWNELRADVRCMGGGDRGNTKMCLIGLMKSHQRLSG